MNDNEFDFRDPTVKTFIRHSIDDMFNKYRMGKLADMDKAEIGVVEICMGFYPKDATKQENLAYCVLIATMQTDSLTFMKVSEDIIMPLAIELGVEEAIIQEILIIKRNQIFGVESN